MRYILGLLFMASIANAKTLKIALIDSGLDDSYQTILPLCPDGHKSYVSDRWNTDIENKHGTVNANLIHVYAGKKLNYCIVVYKIINNISGVPTYIAAKAINDAVKDGADIVNLSIWGFDKSKEEETAIKNGLDKDVVFIVAAGNNNINLDKNCVIYPACYKFKKSAGFLVVGNRSENGRKSPQSNYGEKTVLRWEYGDKIRLGTLVISGTSQACAIATGKIVRKFLTYVAPRKQGDYEN